MHTTAATFTAVVYTPLQLYPQLSCAHRCSHIHSCRVHTTAATSSAVMCTLLQPCTQPSCTHHHSHRDLIPECCSPRWQISLYRVSPGSGSHQSVSICGSVYSGHFTYTHYVGSCAWPRLFGTMLSSSTLKHLSVFIPLDRVTFPDMNRSHSA